MTEEAPKPCCCGRFENLSEPSIINDTLHERRGAGKFCGPVVNHEVRDLFAKVQSLESSLAAMTKERDTATSAAIEAQQECNHLAGVILKLREENKNIVKERDDLREANRELHRLMLQANDAIEASHEITRKMAEERNELRSEVRHCPHITRETYDKAVLLAKAEALEKSSRDIGHKREDCPHICDFCVAARIMEQDAQKYRDAAGKLP